MTEKAHDELGESPASVSHQLCSMVPCRGQGSHERVCPNLILETAPRGNFIHHCCIITVNCVPYQFPSQGGLGWRSVLTFTLFEVIINLKMPVVSVK